MKASTAAVTASIDGRDQYVTYTVAIDLSGLLGSSYADIELEVTSLSITGDSVTDSPEGARLEDGYTAYQCEFTCAGRIDPADETKNAAWFFARYPYPAGDGTLTPLAYLDAFAAPVVVTWSPLDGSADPVEVFVGEVDSYRQDAGGEVAFTCIDGRNQLRGIVDLPAVITAPPYNSGLTSEFAVDALLRAVTDGQISSWPARRASCVLAAGMRSSLWPEVGTLSGSGASIAPIFGPGAFGSALTAHTALPSDVVRPVYQTSAPLVGELFFECWITGVRDGGGLVSIDIGDGAATFMRVTAQGNGIYFRYPDGTTAAWSMAIADAPHYLAGHLTFPGPTASGPVDATLYLDNAAAAFPSREFTRDLTDWSTVAVGASTIATVEALQVTIETDKFAPIPRNNAFVPQAVLDPSLNDLSIIPPVTGDPWQTIQQIAAAELAVAGFFGGRIFRFYNRTSIVARPIARTLTSAGALETVGVTSDRSGVINHARVGYTAWSFAAARSIIYSADSPIRVPRRSTKVITASLDTYAVDLDTTAAVLPNGAGGSTTTSNYRASVDQYGNARHPGGLSFTFTQPSPDKITITVVNDSGVDAWLVSPADNTDLTVGTPLLRVSGRQVTPTDEILADTQWPAPEFGGAATSRFGEVATEITGNAWLQSDTAAENLADYVVFENYQPRADLTDVAILPDPRLEPMDGLHLIDAARTGVDDYARLFGFTVTYEVGDDGSVDYSMSIDARAFGPPGAWLLGIPGRSELAATTILRGMG